MEQIDVVVEPIEIIEVVKNTTDKESVIGTVLKLSAKHSTIPLSDNQDYLNNYETNNSIIFNIPEKYQNCLAVLKNVDDTLPDSNSVFILRENFTGYTMINHDGSYEFETSIVILSEKVTSKNENNVTSNQLKYEYNNIITLPKITDIEVAENQNLSVYLSEYNVFNRLNIYSSNIMVVLENGEKKNLGEIESLSLKDMETGDFGYSASENINMDGIDNNTLHNINVHITVVSNGISKKVLFEKELNFTYTAYR